MKVSCCVHSRNVVLGCGLRKEARVDGRDATDEQQGATTVGRAGAGRAAPADVGGGIGTHGLELPASSKGVAPVSARGGYGVGAS